MNLEIVFENKNSKKSLIFTTFELQGYKQPYEAGIVLIEINRPVENKSICVSHLAFNSKLVFVTKQTENSLG